jgi:hypothetical protein
MNNIELLDYFAGHALQSLISSKKFYEVMGNDDKYYYPKRAYLIAEAMVEERERRLSDKTKITTAKQVG